MVGFFVTESKKYIIDHIDDEDKGVAKCDTLIQGTGSNYKSNAVCINESGLYSIILQNENT